MRILDCTNPEDNALQTAVEVLHAGGVVIYPTDTVYGLGCDLSNPQAIDRVYSIKNIPRRRPLSLMCSDVTQISEYGQLTNEAFKFSRQYLPGPYTLILQATRLVPRILMPKKRTVGIRVPDHPFLIDLIKALGRPLLNTSARMPDDEEQEQDPEIIAKRFPNVDLVLNFGLSGTEPSTVIDFSSQTPTVIREGRGSLEGMFLN